MRAGRWFTGSSIALLAIVVGASCGPESGPGAGDTPPDELDVVLESPEAARRVEALRARFGGERVLQTSVEGTTFEPTSRGLRVAQPEEARRGVARPARVELPTTARGAVTLEDETSGVAIRFSLRDAAEAPVAIGGGMAVYEGALDGADLVHRVHAEGTEDYLVFERRPAREEVVYEVQVGEVAGLRLVENTLELLDEAGAPRLAVSPPFLVDSAGARHDARLALEGCAFDDSPAAPWGREVTPPGAGSCAVRVGWSGAVLYPAVLDPAWVTTGSMTASPARTRHTATDLADERVLVAGGIDTVELTSAQLFDPATGSWAATGALATLRRMHTATRLASGDVLVVGGRYRRESDGATVTVSAAEIYDPGAGSFVASAATYGRSGHRASLLQDGRVLISGGLTDFGSAVTSARLYDPVADSITATDDMAWWRAEHTSTLLPSGRVFVLGSSRVNSGVEAEIYDPVTETFSDADGTDRYFHTATLLPSGLVFIAGGFTNQALSSTRLFDPSTGALANGPSMGIARGGHTATLLQSGLVLLAGGGTGVGGAPVAQPEALLYDPATNTITSTTSLPEARVHHTASLLPSGKVLVAGGGAASYLYDLAFPGAECAGAADCISGICDERCCTETCGGSCETCAAGDGGCLSVTSADDPNSCTGANTCDATGACKLKNGQTCASGAVCASGQCVDGRCCDTACDASCDVCNRSGLLGTCSPAVDAAAGSPSCAPFLCDGTATTCPTTCVGDVDCAASAYCASDDTCQPRKADGLSCDQAAGADCNQVGCRVCTSSLCVDGVCCATACGLACDVCSGAGDDGTCTTALVGTQTTQCDGAQACNGLATSCPSGCSTDADCALDHYCAASNQCLPRKAQGITCSLTAGVDCEIGGCRVCASDFCEDGRCCDQDCGPCGSCANPEGLCAATPANQPPSPAGACGLFQCNGADADCPSACTSTAGCVAGHYCLEGACVPELAQGAACTINEECATGACADGVCCDTACSGICLACAAANKQSGSGDGTCGVARIGTNPGGQCIDDTTNPCGTVAACRGTSAECAQAPVGTSCGPTTCDAGTVVGEICNGQGVCEEDATEPCFPYLCQGDECTSPCSGNAACADGHYCSGGLCAAQAENGSACTVADHCASGFCVDGVCCNSPCQGQCQACAEAGTFGTCATVEGAPRAPRAACAGEGPCQGECDGGDPNACALPGGATACGDDAACVGLDVSQPAEACDGSGACETPRQRSCAPYTCDAASGTCRSSCVSSAECAQGASCDPVSGACAPTSATCADDFTILTPDGQLVSCTPYRCLAGNCQQQCAADDDCAESYVCESSSCVEVEEGTGGAGPGSGGEDAASSASSATGSTGAATTTAATAGGADGGTGDEDGAASDGGCGCEAPGRAPQGNRAAIALLLVAGAAGTRFRRRVAA